MLLPHRVFSHAGPPAGARRRCLLRRVGLRDAGTGAARPKLPAVVCGGGRRPAASSSTGRAVSRVAYNRQLSRGRQASKNTPGGSHVHCRLPERGSMRPSDSGARRCGQRSAKARQVRLGALCHTASWRPSTVTAAGWSRERYATGTCERAREGGKLPPGVHATGRQTGGHRARAGGRLPWSSTLGQGLLASGCQVCSQLKPSAAAACSWARGEGARPAGARSAPAGAPFAAAAATQRRCREGARLRRVRSAGAARSLG